MVFYKPIEIIQTSDFTYEITLINNMDNVPNINHYYYYYYENNLIKDSISRHRDFCLYQIDDRIYYFHLNGKFYWNKCRYRVILCVLIEQEVFKRRRSYTIDEILT